MFETNSLDVFVPAFCTSFDTLNVQLLTFRMYSFLKMTCSKATHKHVENTQVYMLKKLFINSFVYRFENPNFRIRCYLYKLISSKLYIFNS